MIHYFGFAQKEILLIKDICQNNNIFLLEDCAHLYNSRCNDIQLGSVGDFSIFSIHKIFATEDGGFLKINNASIVISDPKKCDEIDKKSLEIFEKSDVQKIAKLRISNYNTYLDLLENKERDFEILYKSLPVGIVPLNFPILIHKGNREKIYFKLIEKEVITVSLYYNLIEEIDENEFPLSYEISSKILNLPVHQDINKRDIIFIVNKLYESFKEID